MSMCMKCLRKYRDTTKVLNNDFFGRVSWTPIMLSGPVFSAQLELKLTLKTNVKGWEKA